MTPSAVIGGDMSAALALGNALGVPLLAMTELLPVIEAVMVRAANAGIAASLRSDGQPRIPQRCLSPFVEADPQVTIFQYESFQVTLPCWKV